MRILVVEDEPELRRQVCERLEGEGYQVQGTGEGNEGLYLAGEYAFDAAIVDIGLPGISGIEVIRRLRKKGSLLPVLVLTARGRWQDKVEGLEAGADDYLTKPFQMEELLARVKALLRRASPERIKDVLAAGDVSLDRQAHRVTRGSREIHLGPTEYRLLEVFLESGGRVLSRNQLIDRVWGTTAEIDERTIDVHIGRLRKSLVRGNEADPIRTVRGAGYALALEGRHD
jgi:two-component system phosphate regulon response regulator PhoB